MKKLFRWVSLTLFAAATGVAGAAMGANEVVVIATAQVKPGTESAFIEQANFLVGETRKEKGVVSYTYHQSVDSPTEFVFVEHYESQDAFQAHFHGKVLANFFGKVKELFLPGYPVIKQYRELTP